MTTSAAAKPPLFTGNGNGSLQGFASPIVAKNHFVKASFGGFAGSGKTKTASDFVIGVYKQMGLTAPVLFIDNEKGSRFLVPKFKQAGIECLVKDTVELADVIRAMDYLDNGDIGFLFIDSLSKVWYKYIADYRAKNHLTFMSLQDWGKILPAWQEEFSNRFVKCCGNIVFTGRGGYSYEKEEDETNEQGRVIKKGQFVKSGVKMKMAGETPFEPDLNIWMEQEQEIVAGVLSVWREAQVLKDRNDTATSLDGKVFKNPTYADLKPVVDFIMSIPTGEVMGHSSTENMAPGNDPDYFEKRKRKDIALEKIEGILTTAYPGQTAAEKKHKVAALEVSYGTKSWTEIKSFPVDKIEAGLPVLEKYTADHAIKERELV